MNNSVVLSIKIPKQLKERIDILAHKGLVTRNKWIVRGLSRIARYKPSVNDSSASGKPKSKE